VRVECAGFLFCREARTKPGVSARATESAVAKRENEKQRGSGQYTVTVSRSGDGTRRIVACENGDDLPPPEMLPFRSGQRSVYPPSLGASMMRPTPTRQIVAPKMS
jgi:hypothetical protein